jgi:hypothetical protein
MLFDPCQRCQHSTPDQPTEVRESDWMPAQVTYLLFIFGILLGLQTSDLGQLSERVRPKYLVYSLRNRLFIPANANTEYVNFYTCTKSRFINHYKPHAMIISSIQTTAYKTQLHSQCVAPP